MPGGSDAYIRALSNLWTRVFERSKPSFNSPIRDVMVVSETFTHTEDTSATMQDSDTTLGIYPAKWGADAAAGIWGEFVWS